MNIVSIIPARGGSKGVPRKNIKILGKFPLVSYGICSSLNAEMVGRTVVSTDDEEIATVSKKYGAEIIIRPDDLANDDSPAELCLQHAVNVLEESGWKPDVIVLIQCTTPFRLTKYINESIHLLINNRYTGVASVSEVPGHFHPYKIKEVDDNGELYSTITEQGMKNRIIESDKYKVRQDLPGRYYWMNGAVYSMTYDTLMHEKNRYGMRCGAQIIEDDFLVNIDSIADFEDAEKKLNQGNINLDFNIEEIK